MQATMPYRRANVEYIVGQGGPNLFNLDVGDSEVFVSRPALKWRLKIPSPKSRSDES